MSPRLIPEELVQETIEREFECARCGNCCKGDGVVHFGPDEAERMAGHLGLAVSEFLRRYATQMAKDQWWLADKTNRERWCIFLERDDDGLYRCEVNAAKPDQCRGFPSRWRNEDSYRTCQGLKNLMRELRRGVDQGQAKERTGRAKG